MKQSKTVGKVEVIKAETTGRYTAEGEAVIGSKVTVAADIMHNSKLVKAESTIFLAPGAHIPPLNSEVVMTIQWAESVDENE